MNSKEFDTRECSSNSSKVCILEFEAKYPKELRVLHNNYPSTPSKTEIKKEMLPNYQLKIADSYNIPMGNIKKLVPKRFLIKETQLKLKKYIVY